MRESGVYILRRSRRQSLVQFLWLFWRLLNTEVLSLKGLILLNLIDVIKVYLKLIFLERIKSKIGNFLDWSIYILLRDSINISILINLAVLIDLFWFFSVINLLIIIQHLLNVVTRNLHLTILLNLLNTKIIHHIPIIVLQIYLFFLILLVFWVTHHYVKEGHLFDLEMRWYLWLPVPFRRFLRLKRVDW
jgi:hypothetical protein